MYRPKVKVTFLRETSWSTNWTTPFTSFWQVYGQPFTLGPWRAPPPSRPPKNTVDGSVKLYDTRVRHVLMAILICLPQRAIYFWESVRGLSPSFPFFFSPPHFHPPRHWSSYLKPSLKVYCKHRTHTRVTFDEYVKTIQFLVEVDMIACRTSAFHYKKRSTSTVKTTVTKVLTLSSRSSLNFLEECSEECLANRLQLRFACFILCKRAIFRERRGTSFSLASDRAIPCLCPPVPWEREVEVFLPWRLPHW